MSAHQDSLANCETIKNLPGGWRDTEITPEVGKALQSVLMRMNTRQKLKKITKARTQVVAGINYAIEFEFNNGEIWHTQVFHSLSNKFEMTIPAKQGPLPAICR